MASLRALEDYVPATLSLGGDGLVVVHESLLSLKFGFWLGTVYVEQELFHDTGVVCETTLVQNSKEKVGLFWTLCVGSYKVIGLSEV